MVPIIARFSQPVVGVQSAIMNKSAHGVKLMSTRFMTGWTPRIGMKLPGDITTTTREWLGLATLAVMRGIERPAHDHI